MGVKKWWERNGGKEVVVSGKEVVVNGTK